MSDNKVTKEYCSACFKKSNDTVLMSIEGEQWWRCNHQGCELRVSGAYHYWKPGEGSLESKFSAKTTDGKEIEAS